MPRNDEPLVIEVALNGVADPKHFATRTAFMDPDSPNLDLLDGEGVPRLFGFRTR